MLFLPKFISVFGYFCRRFLPVEDFFFLWFCGFSFLVLYRKILLFLVLDETMSELVLCQVFDKTMPVLLKVSNCASETLRLLYFIICALNIAFVREDDSEPALESLLCTLSIGLVHDQLSNDCSHSASWAPSIQAVNQHRLIVVFMHDVVSYKVREKFKSIDAVIVNYA